MDEAGLGTGRVVVLFWTNAQAKELEEKMKSANDPSASRFGGEPAEIARGLIEYAKSAEALSADQPRLIDEHPKKWVGVYQGKVSARADDLQTLMSRLEKQGIPPGNAIIRFIEQNQRTMIL